MRNESTISCLLLLASACSEADPPPGGSAGGLEENGHDVECCYTATVETNLQSVKQIEVCDQFPTCVDKTVVSGSPTQAELMAQCDLKCPPLTDLWLAFPWVVQSGLGFNEGVLQVFGCTASVATSLTSMNSCEPTPIEQYGAFPTYPPTHEAFFASADPGNAVQFSVNGKAVAANFVVTADIGLQDCSTKDIDGGACQVVLRGLSLDIPKSFVVGGYTVESASASLVEPVVADAQFSPCGHGICTGEFTFSKGLANAVELNLTWTQAGTNGKSTASLLLSNGGLGMGGIHDLVGRVQLDPQGVGGELQLVGLGSDAFTKGSFASIDFDLTAPLDPL